MYVKWLANNVHVIKKNATLWVCIEFRYLTVATPKYEYLILVGSMTSFEYLSLLDGYSGCKQIFYYRGRCVENDISMP